MRIIGGGNLVAAAATGAAAGAAITADDLAGAGVVVAALAGIFSQHSFVPERQPASSKAASANVNNPYDRAMEYFVLRINFSFCFWICSCNFINREEAGSSGSQQQEENDGFFDDTF